VKAAVLRGTGDKFVIDDLRLRALGPRDVQVRVAASGVCHSDLSIQDGTIPHPLPAVLGHEGAGVVTAAGADVTAVSPGDHVVLAWVAPCRACFFCLRGHPELCEHGLDHAFASPYATGSDGTAYLAAFGTATFGEETIVPERACVRIDADFPLELAALVGNGARFVVSEMAGRSTLAMKAEELGLRWIAEIGAHGNVAGPDNSLQSQPANAIKHALGNFAVGLQRAI